MWFAWRYRVFFYKLGSFEFYVKERGRGKSWLRYTSLDEVGKKG